MSRVPGVAAGYRSCRRPTCPKCGKSDQAARLGDHWYCARCEAIPAKQDASRPFIEMPTGVADPRKTLVRDALPRRDRRRAKLTKERT